jgi:hypothetical protein
MKPSSPGLTLCSRSSCGGSCRMVVPSVPPGTSSAPTSVASTVRAQQHSKAPQPLLTVLPSVTGHRAEAAGSRRRSRWSRRCRRGPRIQRDAADAWPPARRRPAPPIRANRAAHVRRPAWRRPARPLDVAGAPSSPSGPWVRPRHGEAAFERGHGVGRVEGHGRRCARPTAAACRWPGRAGSSRSGRPGRARRCGRAGRGCPAFAPASCSSTWIIASMKAASVLGLIGTHSAERRGDRQVRLD